MPKGDPAGYLPNVKKARARKMKMGSMSKKSKGGMSRGSSYGGMSYSKSMRKGI